ncbi:unnamed protein product [Coccothraustes coccothraustes]
MSRGGAGGAEGAAGTEGTKAAAAGNKERQCGNRSNLRTNLVLLNSLPCTHTLSGDAESPPDYGDGIRHDCLPQARQNLPERLRSPVVPAGAAAEPARPPGLRPLRFPSPLYHRI